MPKLFPRFVPAVTSVVLLLVVVYIAVYTSILSIPQIASAASAATSTIVTLDVTSGISISVSSANTSLSTALGIAQNSAIGTTTWTVNTNDSAGYTLGINATSSPAMASTTASTTVYVADYQTGAPNAWAVANGAAAFGYSVIGTDKIAGWGTGSSCSGATSNATSTTLLYKGFTTSPFTIASRTSTTTPSGITTTVCYAVEQNNFYIPSSVYQATIVATATAL